MSAISNGSPAASVSHTVKREKKRRRFYINKKSCIAMAVSVALLFTSVDGTIVHAEELADILPPVTEEVNPTVSGNTIISEGYPYLTNDEGAVIINSFKALQKKDSRIELEERKTLEEVLKLMPGTLTANVTPVSSVEGEMRPDEGEVKPGEGEQPVEDETNPGEGETNPGEGEASDEGETNPGEGEQPAEGETNPGEGEAPGEGETDPGEGEQPGEGEMNPGEGEQQLGAGDNGDQGGVDSGSGDNGGANDDNGGQDMPDSGSGDNGGADTGNGDQGGADSGNPDGSNGEDGSSSDMGEDTHSDDPGEAESLSTEDGAIDVAAAVARGTSAQDGRQWRLLVETGESDDNHAGSEPASADSDAGDHNGGEESASEEVSGGSTDTGSGGSEEDTTGGTENGSGGIGDDAAGGMENGNDGIGDTESGNEGDNADGTESGNGGNEPGANSGIEDGNTDDMTDGDGTDTSIAGEGENPSGTEEGNSSGAGKPDTTVPSEDGATPETVEVEVPVTWECKNYDPEGSDVYTFAPKWDEEKWFFEESKEHKIPTIKVVYTGPASEVSTEEELTAAFAAGVRKIVLKNDIALTKPLTLPADADIELDGGGYKLTRGNVTTEEGGSSETFLGIMIEMDGEDYTEDTYGTLTLKDITVDGGTEADRAGAPAILDRGNLILDEGAVVRDNFNYGTYPEEKDGETILDYGGGIQVYGELTVSPDALVTENFADEFGGGVYLESGATLYLYVDVIVDNSVGEGHGYGADLYAAPGSTIYYDPSIDMEREGFYICEGVNLIPMGVVETDLTDLTPLDKDDRREIYINVAEGSGYADDLDALIAGLQGLGYTVINSRTTKIDTTDLRDWYVYDHYDTHESCWGPGTMANPSQSWIKEYGAKNEKRKFYPRDEPRIETQGVVIPNPVTTIADWLNRQEDYYYSPFSSYVLAHFKEHIYSRNESDGPAMTFVGYTKDALVDFLFYDPMSTGDKVVDFNVDSSKVQTHTLTGSGFLVNTNVDENNLLYGYLVYYVYTDTSAQSVSIYKLDGVDVDKLHGGSWDFKYDLPFDRFSLVAQEPKSAWKEESKWQTKMSIQIKATPDRIEVRQKPETASQDISDNDPVVAIDLEQKSTYSGFGPLVAYTTDKGGTEHNCIKASSFTYSNLSMYFTNPMEEQADMLNPLQEADFTQDGTQKYFINLFGDAEVDYNDTADFGQYQEFIEMMQKEGIALITDRETPFAGYLGDPIDPDDLHDPNDSNSNLVQLKQGDSRLSVEELIKKIHASIVGKTSTDLDDKVDDGSLSPAHPKQSVGNIWLKSGEDQVRVLEKKDFGGEGRVEIQIMDDVACYTGGNLAVTYEIWKPGKKGYTTLNTVGPNTPVTFVVDVNEDMKDDWPSGDYIVRQRISNSSICGYAYFTLDLPTQPVEPVDPTFPVTVKVTVKKDDEVWNEHGKVFKLQPEGGGTLIDLPGEVSAGTYDVYDVTGLEADDVPTEDRNRGSVTVENANQSGTEQEVIIDYYTVTFYDGEDYSEDDTPLAKQTILSGQPVSEPEEPSKPSGTFAGWMTRTQDGESIAYDFSTPITATTKIYASWAYPVEVEVTVKKDDEEWKNHDRTFKLMPEGGGTLKDLSAVSAGTYDVYDVTESAEGIYTDVQVTVPKANQSGTKITTDKPVNYYTFAFYDGEDYSDDGTSKPKLPAEQIVLSGQPASEPNPEDRPARPPYVFAGWVTEAEGRNLYDFSTPVRDKTNVYASWTYPVAVVVTVKIDKEDPKEPHGRHFALWSGVEDDKPVEEPFLVVPTGKYTVYDVTGLKEVTPYYLTESRNTGQSVEVKIADTKNTWEDVEVNYYSVTFYDENTADEKPKPCESGDEPNPQIVLKNQCAYPPGFELKRDKYTFAGWVTSDGSLFDFETKLDSPTEIYASWEKIIEPRYQVTIYTRKDGGEWRDSGRIFALRLLDAPEDDEEVEETVFDLAQVKKGTYRVYDITGSRFRAADTAVKVDDGDTGVTVTVENEGETVTVDYYTVTFYDGKKAYGTDTLQGPTIVLSGKKAAEPPAPVKKGYRFNGWLTENKGSTAFNFDQEINSKTDIYAGWKAVSSARSTGKPEETPPDVGGSAEDTQTVTVLQESSPQAITPTSGKTPSGDKEPRTGDTTRIEIYATMTMISGFMYLLFYFREEGRGMTEREKEVFVAAFIRWAKKGGRFRRCCALVAIFFILVYYHSIGKRVNKNSINRAYLKQALYKEYR